MRVKLKDKLAPAAANGHGQSGSESSQQDVLITMNKNVFIDHYRNVVGMCLPIVRTVQNNNGNNLGDKSDSRSCSRRKPWTCSSMEVEKSR